MPSMLLLHTTYLTCCFLALPLHAISGWDKKQSERWVIASIFLLHDLCCSQFPINNVCITLLSPTNSLGSINIHFLLQSFLGFFYLYFSRKNGLNMLLFKRADGCWCQWMHTVFCYLYINDSYREHRNLNHFFFLFLVFQKRRFWIQV